ncbi:MAG: ligase-associated DNA damage response DEXH box helicase [Alphaproteobacteria bacterium]
MSETAADLIIDDLPQPVLPQRFLAWFGARGWRPRRHQVEVLHAIRDGEHVLLSAPTGGGKTLAGFLPSLVDLADGGGGKLHTLYVSPLKALTTDIERNLSLPVAEIDLPIRVETRNGDTPQAKRQRQQRNPPDLLLITPEQLALMLSYREADRYFRHLKHIVIDELHSLTAHKRGDLLALGLARLASIAPAARRIGLSATVADPDALGALVGLGEPARLVLGEPGPRADIKVLSSETRVPWSGHLARHTMAEVYDALRRHNTTLVFVNTRAQAEIVFQELWRRNDDNLAIALHHGSLAPEQRRKVEAAMVRGDLRAVVCTSTLDLGIDWGDVDLVIQIGAPKGLSRLVQRIGRANHRLDEPSAALLVPANRFEVLECQAAAAAVMDGELDGEAERAGALDVLAQHLLGRACSAPFDMTQVYDEIRRAPPYAALTWEDFEATLDFVATGGYALRRYERYHRLSKDENGLWTVANQRVARQYRLNVGTIVEAPMIRVKLGRGRELGKIEEWFIEQLKIGDTFVFAGEVLRFEGLRDMVAVVSRATGADPSVPSYYGGKFPLSTYLAARVRDMLADEARQKDLPWQVKDWLKLQRWRSVLPGRDDLLVETFPRGGRFYTIAYPFEGRLAHQTLGMLLTRRMDRAGLRPLGFVASEYALAVWSLRPIREKAVNRLFEEDMLGDDLEAWLNESNLMKRTFRNVAVIAGLIDRRHPGEEKTGRQVTFSSDLIYDVLRQYQGDHILLRATYADAAAGLIDVARVAAMLQRIQGRITFQALDRVSPLAVPLMLEIGREAVPSDANEAMLAEAAEALIDEATRLI